MKLWKLLFSLVLATSMSSALAQSKLDFKLDKRTGRIGPMTISNIKPGTPAANAGLRDGDRIVAIDEISLTNAFIGDVMKATNLTKTAKTFKMTYARGASKPVTVVIQK